MGSTAMDPDGVQWGLKGRHMECIGQANKLSTNVTDHGAMAKTRNWDVVGQDCKATRSRGALHK